MKAMARLFCAVGDPTRLRLLRLLHGQELCVCELMEAVLLPQYQVSRHLRELRNAGLVEARRNGRWMHYRISRRAAADPLCLDLLKVVKVHTRNRAQAKRDDGRLAQRKEGRVDRRKCA